MAKKTTKIDASSRGADKDLSPAEPAKRAVAKLARSVQKKIKSVLEPKAPKKAAAKPLEEPAAPGQSNGGVPTRRKSREPGVTPTSRKSNRAATAGKRAGGNGVGFTNDEVALRAYFLAQRRMETGQPGTPEEDWIEAERQLASESGQVLVPS